MDTHLTEPRELDSSTFDSVVLKQTLDGFSPNSPSPPPPIETLDDLFNSSSGPSDSNADDSSNFDYLSPCPDETLDDQSDSALFLDVDSQEDEEEDDTLHSSPVNTAPAYSSSHWSTTPWDSRRGKSEDTKALSLDWPEPWLLGEELKPSELGLSELWSLQEETETKPLVSVYVDWYNEIKPAIVGSGLANLGNTCFLNAVLQCFTYTVPLIQGLWSYYHPRPCYRDIEGFCVLCSLRYHIELSLTSMGRVVTPWTFVDNLSYLSSNFQRFQQEDAHEFLQCFLDRLESCYIYSNMKDMAFPLEDENLVKQVFGGRLISKLQCCNCGHCSDTYEPLIDLSLEIEDVGSLPSALESFTRVEKIEDPETKFTCEKCKERVSVEKQLLLDQAPSVAAFHLKRFKNDGSYVEKIDKFVEFPLELNLLPYTSASQNNNVELKYDLYAIVVHIGFSSTSGHYYSFVRSAPDAWFRLDDSKVVRVREDYVLSQEAYILFYAKRGTPWLSSLMETDKSSVDPTVSNNSPKSVLDNVDHISTSSPHVANNCSCEINKAREDVVGISVEPSNGFRHDGVEGNESQRLSTPVPPEISDSTSGASCEVEKKLSPSVLTENSCNQEFDEVKNGANITSSTPPSPPSPDIYAEEPPVASYSIPCGEPLSERQVPCKRELDNDLEEDSHRKQARKLLKNMPNTRSAELLAAMNGSQGSSNSKRGGRVELSSNRNDRPSSSHHKANLDSFLRPVAAGSLR
ncbi:unnamed protein product [Camellia sinensis]